jgi:DNA repair ATPase RecN
MINIPNVFQQRINSLLNEYKLKALKLDEKYEKSSEFYKNKINDIKKEIEDIYNNENINAVEKANIISKLVETLEKYVKKYEEPIQEVNNLKDEFLAEINKISDMIHQSKPEYNINDITNSINEYIIINIKDN